MRITWLLNLLLVFLITVSLASENERRLEEEEIEKEGRNGEEAKERMVVEFNPTAEEDSLILANEFARTRGLKNRGLVMEDLPNTYLFEGSPSKRRRIEEEEEALEGFVDGDATVKFLDSRRRFHRSTDPLFSLQWHLSNSDGIHINSQEVIRQQILGKGVTVAVVDDGIYHRHPDLITNYSKESSYDYNNYRPDPSPESNYDTHGTRCAGEISAEGGNNIFGVGVAPKSKLVGIKILSDFISDATEAQALSHKRDKIDIYSNSWGPMDDGATVDGPGEYTTKALEMGVQKGRGGLGSVFVFASGNGGTLGDNCNCDGYVNSPHTIAVGAVNKKGGVPYYQEVCAAQLCSAPSGDYDTDAILTVDVPNTFTLYHSGTSAAAPLVSGVIALMLEANPRLSFRDIQHILVISSSKRTERISLGLEAGSNPFDTGKNGAGLYFSHYRGFGIVDALGAVSLAQSWEEDTINKEMKKVFIPVVIPGQPKTCGNFRFGLSDESIKELSYSLGENLFLEHVRVTATVSYKRGETLIDVIAPSGKVSRLSTYRPRDKNGSGFVDWTFDTVAHWGEPPRGEWDLIVSKQKSSVSSCVVKGLSVEFQISSSKKQNLFS